MVRKYLGEMSANLQLAVHLAPIEADDIPVRREEKGEVARIALVPRFQQPRVQLARFSVPVRAGCVFSDHRPPFSLTSLTSPSIRRSGTSHISATST